MWLNERCFIRRKTHEMTNLKSMTNFKQLNPIFKNLRSDRKKRHIY
jgi:hypothetical protein